MTRIAVPYEEKDKSVFQHFGHTGHFKVYDVEGGKVTITYVVNTNGSGHGALADILKKLEVETLICGGIGDGAKRALTEAGINFFGGVEGAADEAVADYLSGTLRYNPGVTCEHAGEHHGEDGCHGEDGHCGGNCHG
ncbi:MAG TPA: NifB/NifX family molybdenum-iron cluster-binding protein [Terriglobales bacterium]|nr:NifB/NifX family molybdenum-iron cluster-binding protein [Terriglobales bacterium]